MRRAKPLRFLAGLLVLIHTSLFLCQFDCDVVSAVPAHESHAVAAHHHHAAIAVDGSQEQPHIAAAQAHACEKHVPDALAQAQSKWERLGTIVVKSYEAAPLTTAPPGIPACFALRYPPLEKPVITALRV